jgi:hypothetical protein
MTHSTDITVQITVRTMFYVFYVEFIIIDTSSLTMSSSPLEVAAKIGMLVKLHVDNGVDKGEYTYWVCLCYLFFYRVHDCNLVPNQGKIVLVLIFSRLLSLSLCIYK